MLPSRLGRGARLLREGSRQFNSSSNLAAVPALTNQQSTGGGWLSKLFGGPTRLTVPLTDPLPGVELPAPSAPPAKAPEMQMSTLSNGVKVASEDTLGPTTTIGLYVDSGSVYEEPHQTGVSHLLEYLSFKSTWNRTHFRLVREIEAIGANVLASASREQMAYTIDAVKTNTAEAVEVLTDAVMSPKFEPWEVKDAIAKLEADLPMLRENPQSVLLEGIHSVAYTGALAKPLIAPGESLKHLSVDVIADFVATNYTAPRIVLAGSGVEHGSLRALAEPMLESLPGAPALQQPASTYVGGDFRQYAAGPLTHVILGFETPGGWNNMQTSVCVTILQYLLGGGGSFSAGGPGKGMHSRLYKRVLNSYAWFQNCTAFSSIYNNTGLAGIFSSVESAHAEEAVSIMTKELLDVAKDIPADELSRAKRAAISQVLMNLESKPVVSEDIGRQILTYGHRKKPSEFIAAIEKTSAADLMKVVNQMLKSPPAVAALGAISSVPRYTDVAKRFG